MSLIAEKVALSAAGAGGGPSTWAMEIRSNSMPQYYEDAPYSYYMSNDGNYLHVVVQPQNPETIEAFMIDLDGNIVDQTSIKNANSSGGIDNRRTAKGYPENDVIMATIKFQFQSIPESEILFDYSSSNTPSISEVEQTYFLHSQAYSAGNSAGNIYGNTNGSGAEMVCFNMGAYSDFFAYRGPTSTHARGGGSMYVKQSYRYYFGGNFTDYQYQPCVYTVQGNAGYGWVGKWYSSSIPIQSFGGGICEDSTGTYAYFGKSKYGYDTTFGIWKVNESDGSFVAGGNWDGKCIGGSSDDRQYQYDIEINDTDDQLLVAFKGKDEYLESGRWWMPGFATVNISDLGSGTATPNAMQYLVRTNYTAGSNNEPDVNNAKCFYAADGGCWIIYSMRTGNPSYNTYVQIVKLDPDGANDGATYSFTRSGDAYEIKNANTIYTDGNYQSYSVTSWTASNSNLNPSGRGSVSNSTSATNTLTPQLRSL